MDKTELLKRCTLLAADLVYSYDPKEREKAGAQIFDMVVAPVLAVMEEKDEKLAYVQKMGLRFGMMKSSDKPEPYLVHTWDKDSDHERMFREWSASIGWESRVEKLTTALRICRNALYTENEVRKDGFYNYALDEADAALQGGKVPPVTPPQGCSLTNAPFPSDFRWTKEQMEALAKHEHHIASRIELSQYFETRLNQYRHRFGFQPDIEGVPVLNPEVLKLYTNVPTQPSAKEKEKE